LLEDLVLEAGPSVVVETLLVVLEGLDAAILLVLLAEDFRALPSVGLGKDDSVGVLDLSVLVLEEEVGLVPVVAVDVEVVLVVEVDFFLLSLPSVLVFLT
jgi:hypothetical protein